MIQRSLKRLLAVGVMTSLLLSVIAPQPFLLAQEVASLPLPGTIVSLSPQYTPVLIKGLKINPQNPLSLDFILDTGDSKFTPNSSDLNNETQKLVKYFFASMAVPEEDVWVNLSPYEKDRIIPDSLSKTEMGRDLLAEDYILKQITASLIYPESKLGQDFWQKVYAQTQKQFGNVQIPVNTFNKVWIVADRADLIERNNAVFIANSHLKVMLEEDYLAKDQHQQATAKSTISSQVIRQIVLPELEREVNTGKNFGSLRQIFHSLILASWYKDTLKKSILSQSYANTNKIKGIGIEAKDKEAIYQRYLEAYKKGVFNFIKDDVQQGKRVVRKYFSGGVSGNTSRVRRSISLYSSEQLRPRGDFAMASVSADLIFDDQALMALPTRVLKAQNKQGNHVEIYKNGDEVGYRVARRMANVLKQRNNLGLWTLFITPTGNTAIPVYQMFSEIVDQENIDTSHLLTANMDEYNGTHIYRSFMEHNLFSKIRKFGFRDANILFFDGTPEGLEQYRYKLKYFKELAGGSINLLIGGIGVKGHLAFNEKIRKILDLKDLERKDIEENEFLFDRYFSGEDVFGAIEEILKQRDNWRSVYLPTQLKIALSEIDKNLNTEELNTLISRIRKQPATFYIPKSLYPMIESLQERINKAEWKGQYGPIHILPESEMKADVKTIELAPSTVTTAGNLKDFKADIPNMTLNASSIGMGTILSEDVDEVIIAAIGKSKAWAIASAIQGPQTSDTPASLLQEIGSKVFFITDHDAATQLNQVSPIENVFSVDGVKSLDRDLANDMKNWIQSGLQITEEKRAYALNSKLHPSSGHENGWSLGFDFSGTNCKIVANFVVNGRVKRSVTIVQKKWGELQQYAKGPSFSALMDEVVSQVKEGLKEHSLEGYDFKVGLSWAFKMRNLTADSGMHLEWSKNFNYPEVVNADPVAVVQAALNRAHLNYPVRALLNDTTATLLMVPNAIMAVILGTGFNKAFVDPKTGNIIVEETASFKLSEKFRSSENRKYQHEYRSMLPKEIQDTNPFEKLITSVPLAEMTRMKLRDKFPSMTALKQAGVINDIWMSDFEVAHMLDKNLAKNLLAKAFAVNAYQIDDNILEDAYKIVHQASTEAAYLASMSILSSLEYMNVKEGLIPVDGSVFWKYYGMKERITQFLSERLSKDPQHPIKIDFIENQVLTSPKPNTLTFIHIEKASANGASIAALRDDAAVAKPLEHREGGINLNASRMNIHIQKEGSGVQINSNSLLDTKYARIQGVIPRINSIQALKEPIEALLSAQ